MKKKRIPLFSGYRKRREAAARREAQEQIVNGLNKTMAQQRARVYGVRPKKAAEEPAAEPEETVEE